MSPAPSAGPARKSRLDKLGIQPGSQATVLGLMDPGFIAELQARCADVATTRVTHTTDTVFVMIENAAGLRRLTPVVRAMRPDTPIWAVWPKGQPHIGEDAVRSAALALGLVDIKVIAFDERLSALKLVVRAANR
jgi:hypothetical protein